MRNVSASLALALFSACASPTSSSQPADFQLSQAADGTQQYSRNDRDPARGTDEVVPGEAESIEKAGCAYIQWCNAPDEREVVCVQSRRCYGDDTIIECFRDADSVCGNFNDLYIDWL